MDPVLKKETGYIAAGTVIISAIVQAVWALCFKYDISVFLGALWGGAAAIGNFLLMGMAVAKAANETDELAASRRMRASYSMRRLGLGAVFIIAYFVPQINWVMTLVSLFFPRLTILVEPVFRKDLRKGGSE